MQIIKAEVSALQSFKKTEARATKDFKQNAGISHMYFLKKKS